MPVLYFDNFRGFRSTYLDLTKINFFVGENSTGKTSVLKLIAILSDSKFWQSLEFSSEQADLGYFSEIATDIKKPLEVGIVNSSNKQGISAFRFRFIEKDGLPFIKDVIYLDDGINIEVQFEKADVKFRYLPIETPNVAEGELMAFFSNWVNSNPCENLDYRPIKFPFNVNFGSTFLLLRFQIGQEIEADKVKTRGTFTISPFDNEVAWLAPIRTEPKRTYDSYRMTFHPDGTHSPYILKSLLLNNNKRTKVAEKILRKFGADSGLFEEIKIKSLGKTQTSPFEIYITVNGVTQKITNVGYGVSQILPLIIEVISRDDNTWFAIQQPEIHLHPRGQAAFGEFLYKSFVKEGKRFIIETHSDYTIDRFRLRVNKHFLSNSKKQISSQIVFFNNHGKSNTLTCIPILQDGSLPSDQPEEFRAFFIREQMELLKI